MCRSGNESAGTVARRCKTCSSSSYRVLSDRARSLYGTASNDTRERTERLPSRYVFGSVAQRSLVAATTTDAEVLALATRPEESDKVRLAAISNPQVDRRSLRVALASQDAAERAAAHANSSTPIARLRAAVDDPDHHVAVAAIENPRTPDAAIRKALNSHKKKVRRAATLALLDR